MSETQSLSERPERLNQHNYPTESSANYRRNNRIRSIACLALTTLSIITFISILVFGITHNVQIVTQPNSTTINTSSIELTEGDKINISVYYQVYNSESRDLIVNQLVPVQKKYGDYIHVRYIPLGNVILSKKIKENYQYQCNPEHVECHGARLHACLQQRFSNSSDQSQLTSIIACSIRQYNIPGATIDTFTKTTVECIQKYAQGENTRSILCSNAEWLINQNQNEAMLLKPPLKCFPAVTVNEMHLSQDQIRRDLDNVVCKAIKKQVEINC